MAVTETDNQASVVEESQPKTFTQEEVNRIIEGRLAKEKARSTSEIEELREKASKLDAIEEASKTELQKATDKATKLQAELDAMKKSNEIRTIKEKVSTETGVPMNLISGATEEECRAQADAILKFAKPDGYPIVKDGGEAVVTQKRSESDQFADWFKKSLN